MKVIYLSETTDIVKVVYDTSEKVYVKNDIISSAYKFKDTEFIFTTWNFPSFTEEEIKEYFPSLKAVFYGAGSVQSFARPFLNLGIKIFSAWAANAVPVAEYTTAQIILANKGFYKTCRMASNGKHREAREEFLTYKGNFGTKVGIIGVGMIGSLVAEDLKAYKLKVLAFDPFLSDEKAEKLGVEKVSLETLFKECDVVSNHLANNEQTRGILNEKLFSSMPQNATFLNTGRGAQVVEADLISVLKQRSDLTAVLDVTEPEPPEEGSELYSLPNCFLTPHIAGSSGYEVKRMGEYMKAEYENFVNGKETKFEVTLEMLKTMA